MGDFPMYCDIVREFPIKTIFISSNVLFDFHHYFTPTNQLACNASIIQWGRGWKHHHTISLSCNSDFVVFLKSLQGGVEKSIDGQTTKKPSNRQTRFQLTRKKQLQSLWENHPRQASMQYF